MSLYSQSLFVNYNWTPENNNQRAIAYMLVHITFRACTYFNAYLSYPEKEKEFIVNDPVGQQLVAELQSLRNAVKEMNEKQAMGQHMEVLKSLLEDHGPFSHYTKYFKFLLQSVLARHESILGCDLIQVIFPQLSGVCRGVEEADPTVSYFHLNRHTVKSYYDIHPSLV